MPRARGRHAGFVVGFAVDELEGGAVSWWGQASYDVRFEWGPTGVAALGARRVVVVDVLRFTTAVDAAVSRGALVYPYRWKDDSATAYAESVGAVLAGSDPLGPSLSPVRLAQLEPGQRVVLPSPNGSTCAAVAHDQGATVIAACLRNAPAVARWLEAEPGEVAVIACGERWPDGSLRPSLEDCLGAGAVIRELRMSRSPEAEAAAALWDRFRDDPRGVVGSCGSGVEVLERGWAEDLEYACQVGASAAVPVLVDGAFVDATRP